MSYAHLGLAKGSLFPDALAAGPYLARYGGLLFLTTPSGVPLSAQTRFRVNISSVKAVDLIGIEPAVADNVRELLE